MTKQRPGLNGLHGAALALPIIMGTLLLGACSGQEQQQEQPRPVTQGTPAAAEASPEPGIRDAPAFTADELNSAPVSNWLTNGGSLSNERYSPLDEINRDNISELKGEWQTHLESGLAPNHSGQGEPIVHDGVIYQATGQNDVFALSVDTGEILWKYSAGLENSGVTVCCGWVVRGLALGEGLVFVPRLDAHLMALDQQTGEVVWDVEVGDPAAGYGMTAAPRYYDGKVFAGVTGGEYQVRGKMQAFDAASGEELWTFYTIPGPGEFGHETWPDYNDSWMYGGAPIWQTAAIDPELDMLYFSTGNAAPDMNGAVREGDNLFTVSIVALDVNSGEYRWHFQEVHHEIWDYDASSPVVLFDVEKDGVQRKGLSQINKGGYLYLLDRITGEPLTPIIETPVPQEPIQHTAATQPIPQGDPMIRHCLDEAPEGWTLVNNACTYTPFAYEPTLYIPFSGSNWMPTAYDPTRGYLYLCASDSIGGGVLDPDFDESDLGIQTGEMIFGGSFSLPDDLQRHAYQIGVDVRDHSIVWKFESDAGCSSGATVTAGDLLLIGRQDGTLRAYDPDNGEQLWSFQLDAGVAPSPVVFEHEGKQKILVFAAGSLYSPGPKGDSLWLLSLDGTLGPTVPSTLSNAPTAFSTGGNDELALPESEADLAVGEEIYSTICNACHGADGQGGHSEGGVIPRDSTIAHIYTTATRGQNDKMPSFANAYSPAQLKSVATYVHERILTR